MKKIINKFWFLPVLFLIFTLASCFGKEGEFRGPVDETRQTQPNIEPTTPSEEPVPPSVGPAAPPEAGVSEEAAFRGGRVLRPSGAMRPIDIGVTTGGETPPPPPSEPWKYDSSYNDFGNGIAINNATQEVIVVGDTLTESGYMGIILVFDKNSGVLKKVIKESAFMASGNCRDILFQHVAVAADGSFYVVGNMYEGIGCADFKPVAVLLYKFSKTGDNVFKKTLYTVTSEHPFVVASDIAIDDVNGFIYIVGSVKVGTYGVLENAFIARYDSNGDPTGMFEKFPVGSTSSSGYAVALRRDGNGAYIGGRFLSSESVRPSAFLLYCVFRGERCLQIKVDTIGVEGADWSGTSHDREEVVFGVSVSPDGKIYIVGVNDTEARNLDILIIKYNESMNREWVLNNLGTNNEDFGNKVAVDSGGNVYLAGCTNNAPVVFKFNRGSTSTMYRQRFIDLSGTGCADAITVDNEDNIYVVANGAMGPSRGVLVEKYAPGDF